MPAVSSDTDITVIGLGYVGLPLAVALAKKFPTTGFDIDARRVRELGEGHDRTGEIDADRMKASSLVLTADPAAVEPSDYYIVTVPTPIDDNRRPDLGIVRAASRTVGEMIARASKAGKKPTVVYESTVYPGVTEEICVAILEEVSGLTWKEDFFVGYSPERINPGDREHTIDRITKVVAGDTDETLQNLCDLYGSITSGGTYPCANIKAAEAAKVIENAQRDINIAFMNEITQIFDRMDISVWDVLGAANTKWNFLPFKPGLVGGHCIGVDPYYLSHRAEELGHDPKVILAGRGVNDGMAEWLAGAIHQARGDKAGSLLMLGLTFKEDVPDLRNSKVVDLITSLQEKGHSVTVHDPQADAEEAQHEYGIELAEDALSGTYDTVVLAVPHREYLDRGADFFRDLRKDGGMLADLKGALGNSADWTL